MPEVVGMVEQRANVENIRIIQELQSDLPPIMSDPNQLQQVFLNLLNNAIYALTGRNSAEIRIQCLREDSYVTVSVADNGCGISPEDMEKIYLPFFTTKPVGAGNRIGTEHRIWHCGWVRRETNRRKRGQCRNGIHRSFAYKKCTDKILGQVGYRLLFIN